MKKFIAAIILVFMASIPARGAFASDTVTLKDSETGMTENLYAIQGEEDLLLYNNPRFGYNVSVPYKFFTEVVLLPENGDGIILEAIPTPRYENIIFRFRVSGGFVMGFETEMEEAKKSVEENVVDALVFEKNGDDWWELSWWNGPEEGRRRFITDGETWAECEINWPGLPYRAPGEYDDLMERAVQSLVFAALVEAQEIPKVGDDLSQYAFSEDVESHVLKAPVALYIETRSGAGRNQFPAGMTILFGLDSEGQLARHFDDGNWFYVMDENKKLIGWATYVEVESILFD